MDYTTSKVVVNPAPFRIYFCIVNYSYSKTAYKLDF